MLQLKPGQRMKVWHKGRGASALGILIEMADSELTLSLEGSITPEQGDMLVLEIPQEEDALYILQASFKEIGPGDTYTYGGFRGALPTAAPPVSTNPHQVKSQVLKAVAE